MKYNGRLAVTAFICGMGSILLSYLTTILISNFYGSTVLAAVSVSDSIITILQRLLIIPLVIAFFKQSRILNYIAMGVELLVIVLLFAIPGSLIRLIMYNDELYAHGISYLRFTAMIWFVTAGLCVLFSFVIRRGRMMSCFIAAGAATLISFVLTWLMMSVLHFGIAGIAFRSLAQPFHYFLPLLMLNPDRDPAAWKPRTEIYPCDEQQ